MITDDYQSNIYNRHQYTSGNIQSNDDKNVVYVFPEEPKVVKTFDFPLYTLFVSILTIALSMVFGGLIVYLYFEKKCIFCTNTRLLENNNKKFQSH